MQFFQQPFYGKTALHQILSWVAAVLSSKEGRKMDKETLQCTMYYKRKVYMQHRELHLRWWPSYRDDT